MVVHSSPVLARHNVKLFGPGQVPMVFAHGFDCDQNMWRLATPAFEKDYKVVVFDYPGHGGSDRAAYAPARYTRWPDTRLMCSISARLSR